MKQLYLLSAFAALFTTATAQTTGSTRGWHLGSSVPGNYGIGLTTAYRLLAEKKLKPQPVIVGVLDSGVDTLHEDLKAVLWTNPGEIPGNGLDDDKNGFADDVHGWNFLGNPDGRNVLSTSSEWIRVYWRYKDKYEGKTVDTAAMSPAEKYAYAQWQKARSGVVGQGLKEEELANLRQLVRNLLFCDSLLRLKLKKQEYTLAEVETMTLDNENEKNIQAFFKEVFKNVQNRQTANTILMNDARKYLLGEERRASGDKVPPEDNRTAITGDSELNLSNRFYGNNDVQASEPEHGTHVAGTIGAVRGNGAGMDGVADNVRILTVRTTPTGDEHDKDIALAIRYAVDNGAKVINMSFGKSLSPDKAFIDEAVRYAAAHDVLLVHAAGNSKRDISNFDNFPNPRYLFTDSLAPNWITVGASNRAGEAAGFSNYSKNVVNVFAPGVDIYSTFPGNAYQSWEGTSMAAPVVSGLAALLRSYFPQLKAPEIKAIIEQSVTKPLPAGKKPGSKNAASLRQLCTSGGIVNAGAAVALALRKTKRK